MVGYAPDAISKSAMRQESITLSGLGMISIGRYQMPDSNSETNSTTSISEGGNPSIPEPSQSSDTDHVYVEEIEYLNLVDSEGETVNLIPVKTDGKAIMIEVSPAQADTEFSETLLVSIPVITVGVVLLVVVGFAIFGGVLSRHTWDNMHSDK